MPERVALGSPSSKRTEIVDPNTVTINVADAADVEDEDAQDAAAEFNVTRAGTGNIQGIVTVTYRVVEGSASTADYKAPSGELELASNETGTITVLVVNDEIAEGDETFSVLLTGATSDYDPPPEGTPDLLELGTTSAMATISENDDLTAKVTSRDTTVIEGNSATFVVDLGGTSSENIVIDYTVSGDGTNPADEEDYTAPSGSLTIRAGQSSGTIVIRTLDDGVLEPDEGLKIRLDVASPSDVVAVSTNNSERGRIYHHRCKWPHGYRIDSR